MVLLLATGTFTAEDDEDAAMALFGEEGLAALVEGSATPPVVEAGLEKLFGIATTQAPARL